MSAYDYELYLLTLSLIITLTHTLNLTLTLTHTLSLTLILRQFGLVKLDLLNSVAKGYNLNPDAKPGRRLLRDQLAGEGAGIDDTAAFHDVAPYHIATEASCPTYGFGLGLGLGLGSALQRLRGLPCLALPCSPCYLRPEGGLREA